MRAKKQTDRGIRREVQPRLADGFSDADVRLAPEYLLNHLLEEYKEYSSGFFMGLQSFRLFLTGEHKIAVAIFQKQRVELF